MKTEIMLLNLFLPRTRGECIAHFRNMLQLTQIELSRQVGMDRSNISKMENGDITVSETVWTHILNMIYRDFDIEMELPFGDFRNTIELFIQKEYEMSRREDKWNEQRLSWEQETSI
ncbi:helix-turn-helix transcriptional regulator (plasmid) [Cytobacillus oceanisediminis]|uniref:helix-turn-helix domain-containing protein n=1 Tax=Cytobacillus oceanisediminis TaxID=665099 RepID=UPI00186419CB|nr:helix-turn-helix transcriptional regulator [Cytobacillus oceanisediminis]QOK30015.1 helix-turn-helix transcriptional regulator [Cytobacillus oceanisediminis]